MLVFIQITLVHRHYVQVIQHKVHAHMLDNQCIIEHFNCVHGMHKTQHVLVHKIMEVWVQEIVILEQEELQDGQLLVVGNVLPVMDGCYNL